MVVSPRRSGERACDANKGAQDRRTAHRTDGSIRPSDAADGRCSFGPIHAALWWIPRTGWTRARDGSTSATASPSRWPYSATPTRPGKHRYQVAYLPEPQNQSRSVPGSDPQHFGYMINALPFYQKMPQCSPASC
jgi:hypothetical protein